MTWIVAAWKSIASPSEFAYLGSAKAVPIGDEDHGGISLAVAITFRGLDQLLDLNLGQVLAFSVVGVWTATKANCSLLAGWHRQDEDEGVGSPGEDREELTGWCQETLSARAGQKTTNKYLLVPIVDRPDQCRTYTIAGLHDCIWRYIPPLAL